MITFRMRHRDAPPRLLWLRAARCSLPAALPVLLFAAGCTSSPTYQLESGKMADAASVRGTVKWESGLLGNWHSITMSSVDGMKVAPHLLRVSEKNARPVESGGHTVVLECEGNEDSVGYVAYAQIDVVFLPRTAYVAKGQIAVDKVVMWIEREDTAEPVTTLVSAPRMQRRPTGTTYVPVVLPK